MIKPMFVTITALLAAKSLIYGSSAEAQITSPVGDPHWISDADSGCRIHNPAPHPGERVRWTGERCPSGQAAAGWGSLIWSDASGALEEVGYGELVRGVMERQWLTCYPSGRITWRVMTAGEATSTIRVDTVSGWTRTDIGGCAVGSNNTAYNGTRFRGPDAVATAAAVTPPASMPSSPESRPSEWLRSEQGCWVYKGTGNYDAVSWVGGCVDGRAEGQGVLTFFEPGKDYGGSYQGTMQGGRKSGFFLIVANGAASGGRSAGAAGSPRESLAETLRRSAEERQRHNEEVNRQNCARQSNGAIIACKR